MACDLEETYKDYRSYDDFIDINILYQLKKKDKEELKFLKIKKNSVIKRMILSILRFNMQSLKEAKRQLTDTNNAKKQVEYELQKYDGI